MCKSLNIHFNFIRFQSGLALLIFILMACNGPASKPTQVENAKIQLKDDLGQNIVLSKKPVRVLGLSSAMTEILFEVCADSQIVAVSQADNFPDQVRSKPVISTYPLDIEGISKLKPDLCFSEEGMTSTDNSEKLKSIGIPVYFQKYEKVKDVINGIATIGNLVGDSIKTKLLVEKLQAKTKAFEDKLKKNSNAKKPRVMVLIWSDPIYAHGLKTIMHDKIRLAGGVNAITEDFPKLYPELSREYILQKNPDIILGQSFEKMDTTFFKFYPELKRLDAYKNRRIYALNDDLTTRPGPRILESVAEIHHCIQASGLLQNTND